MADFPTLKPTARSFQLGQYPVKTYRALSGAVVRRSFGNKPFGDTLELEFANVPEATVNTIIDHYNVQQGGTLGFGLPADDIFAGYGDALQARAINGDNLEWFYAEPPSISSVIKDISTVTVRLVGEMR
jgi:hypothetical protein